MVMRGFSYCRLDGNTDYDTRESMIEDFNRKGLLLHSLHPRRRSWYKPSGMKLSRLYAILAVDR